MMQRRGWETLKVIREICQEKGTALTLVALLCLTLIHPSSVEAAPVRITLMHTNDLHSHFRPEKAKIGLGGVARLKTAIDRIRKENPNSFLVDGGDWSEGNIYYNSSAGVETLRMMEHLTYDVATLGNHDWINGPEQLLATYNLTHRKVALVGANIDTRGFSRRSEFRKLIPPYVIRETAGVKVAFIGLTTYEFIYDRFFAPIRIKQPYSVVRQLARMLRPKVDAIVLLSHNNTVVNEQLVRYIPEVDIAVGAHDHKKITKPIVIERSSGTPGWVVEAGSWGRYLGRVDFEVTPGKGPIKLLEGKLIQMDRSIPEHKETLAKVEHLEKAIEGISGPIFHDHVGESQVTIGRHGLDNLAGNLATDAYRSATGADVAFDQAAFVYGELHPGVITTSDVFNFNPGIFKPTFGRSWTVHLLPMSGGTIHWILNLLFSSNRLAEAGILSASGLQTTFDPVIRTGMQDPTYTVSATELSSLMALPAPASRAEGITRDTLIQGQPIDYTRTYQVALSGGILHAIEFINSWIPDAIPLLGLKDTHLESWRVVADYIRSITPLNAEKLPSGMRIRSHQSDLGIVESDVNWTVTQKKTQSLRLHITARVHNFGASPAFRQRGMLLRILGNRNGSNTAVDPNWFDHGFPLAIGMIEPGDTQVFDWDIEIPRPKDLYPLTFQIEGTGSETNHSNDQVTIWVNH